MFRVFVSFLFSLAVVTAALNNSPIIGIFSQPTSSTEGNCGGNCLYIAASYVKYIESSGGRVVPIDYYATSANLYELLPSLNGKEFNDAGDYMPLWGYCMGFQWLLMSAAHNANILDPPSGQMDAHNLSIPLDFTSTMKNSKIFDQAPAELIDILAKQNVTMNKWYLP